MCYNILGKKSLLWYISRGQSEQKLISICIYSLLDCSLTKDSPVIMFCHAVEQYITILFKLHEKVQFLLTDKTSVLILKLFFFSLRHD